MTHNGRTRGLKHVLTRRNEARPRTPCAHLAARPQPAAALDSPADGAEAAVEHPKEDADGYRRGHDAQEYDDADAEQVLRAYADSVREGGDAVRRVVGEHEQAVGRIAVDVEDGARVVQLISEVVGWVVRRRVQRVPVVVRLRGNGDIWCRTSDDSADFGRSDLLYIKEDHAVWVRRGSAILL